MLNIFSLLLGIACGLVLFQFISYHLSFDAYHIKAKQIFRVVTDLHLPDGTIEYGQGSPLALAEALQTEIPQMNNQAVLLKKRSFTVAVPQQNKSEDKLFSEHETIAFADQHWFKLFDYSWESGNANTALSEPNTAALTRKQAEKYFGKEDPINKIIRLDNKYEVKVTGVLRDYPPNTDIKVDMFLSLSSMKNFYPDIYPQMGEVCGQVRSRRLCLPRYIRSSTHCRGSERLPYSLAVYTDGTSFNYN